jgi:hypothetical protein
MGVYLVDNPPARSQFRSPRRSRPSGVCVIHTAENTPDFVAFDGGAEAVARYIRDRDTPGSYHDLADSDSAIQLVRYSDEAYQDGTGSNPHAWGGSVATRADVWPLAPKAWRDGAIRQLAGAAARYARWARTKYGIVIPARRITRAQSEQRVPGFISHAERDPARRTDPGAGFPWSQFLNEFTAAMRGTTPQEDDMTPDEFEKRLDAIAKRIGGVTSFKRWMELTYEYARTASTRKPLSQAQIQQAVDNVLRMHDVTPDSALREAIASELAEQLVPSEPA